MRNRSGACLWLLAIFVPTAIFFPLGHAHSFDQCDNVQETGEPIPWVEVGWALAIFSIAEKYCGASPPSMRSVVLRHVEVNGCGPETPVYSKVEEAISLTDAADLKMIVSDGDPTVVLTPEQIEVRARDMAAQIGGCSNILVRHRDWTNWGQLHPPSPQ